MKNTLYVARVVIRLRLFNLQPLAMLKGKRWSATEASREWARLRLCTPA